MTKIKNTKKGMAKKTLSMSLVVAMLATSNVPVWAAEFSDGSDVSVETEAPVVEDNAADTATEAFTDDATPTVEDTTTDAATIDSVADINLENYTVTDLKIGTVGAWDSDVTVSGSIKKDGVEVDGLEYTWMADGVQASGSNAQSISPVNSVAAITYKPSIEDFQKTLSLRIYKRNAAGAVIFSKTITGGVVQAKDISTDAKFSATLSGIDATYTYNGDEQKPVPTNDYNKDVLSLNGKNATITKNDIDWHYEVKGGDLTNYTNKEITVYGTLVGTTDRNSAAYGYTAKTKEAKYKIAKFKIDSMSQLDVNLTKTAFEYSGTADINFGKADIKLEVKVGDKKIDITNALKDDMATGTVRGAGTVGERKPLAYSILSQLDDSDAANEILKNFDINASLKTVSNSNNRNVDTAYTVSKRNLSTCTGTVIPEYNLSMFKGKDNVTLPLTDIKLTGADGQTFTLDKIGNHVVVQVNKAVFDAANAETVGTVENAVTISYKSDSDSVTGSLTLPLTLVSKSLKNVTATVKYRVSGSETNPSLATTKSGATSLSVPYSGKAYDLEDKNPVGADDIYGVTFSDLTVGEYTVSYNDNVNAGIVEVTLTGKGSYAGSVKKFYFKIAPKNLTNGLKIEKGVTVNPANNKDASLYKDALGTKIEADLNGAKTTLEENKDYTVKYYYASKSGLTTEDDIKANEGTNNTGNYVYVVAKPVKGGNYTFNGSATGTLIASAPIKSKSISNVTVTVEKDSYTYTGKEIVPTITVKDGSSTLEKGTDYILKFKDNINVGTATVTVVPAKNSDYDPSTSASATFKVEAAKAEDVVVTLKANGSKAVAAGTNKFNYNKGKQVLPLVEKVTLNGQDVTKDFDITYPTYGENVNAGKDAGSITIEPKTSNFTGTKTQLFTIVGKELTGGLKIYKADKSQITVLNDTAQQYGSSSTYNPYSFRYDGTAQIFGSEVFTADSKFSVTKDTDYEIKYINNVDAGVGFVAVVAKGNYEGNKNTDFGDSNGWYELNEDGYYVKEGVLYKEDGAKKTALQSNIVDIIAFNIEPSYFTAKNITVANGTYAGGVPVKPQVTVSVNGKVLVEGKDYTLDVRAIEGTATPDKFTDVTTGKPYYVTINAKGGYKFDDVNGTNSYVWGIDKKDLKDCTVVVDKNLKATVTNGNVIEEKENFTVKDNGDGTATVSVVDGGKNYTGSVNVEIGGRKVGAPMISNVKVVGNKATVVLSDEVDGASGYDYVISTDKDCITKKNYTAVNKNQAKTSTAFKYVDQGTYYAYCHAWTRDANGKKVFGEWSNGFQFSVTATTPDAPVIKSVKVSGSTVKVTYELSANATGYDVVLGTSSKKDNGELRPYNYGAHKVLNLKESTVTATFKNVPAGTWTVGMHAFNRTSLDGKKVFSPWSNLKTAKVK